MTSELGVLVVGDNQDNVRLVRASLGQQFGNVEVSTRAEQAIPDFEQFLPGVLVLTFDSIEKSQKYSLGLLRLSKVAASHRHYSILLCGSTDVRTAYDLCINGYYDDYVLYWPHPHDGQRLAMAVWNQRRRLGEVDPEHDRTAMAQAQVARQVGAVVERRLAEGLGHVARTEWSVAGVESAVGSAPISEAARGALTETRSSLAPFSTWAADFRSELAPHVAQLRAAAEKVRRPGTSVLVVEDDAFAAKLIVKVLQTMKCEVEVAVDAPGALAALRKSRPAVILMDINLPGMDGLALMRFLKFSPSLNTIPVIMLTGDSRRETIEQSRAVGAQGFIIKPFDREALVAKLSPFLAVGSPAQAKGHA